MNFAKILEELRREQALIEEAILTFERLLASSGKRRGRPPAWLKDARMQIRPPKDSKAALAIKVASAV